MYKTTVKIDGMACAMCEAHVNECIRNRFAVKNVKSSHTKKEAVLLSETAPEEAALREAIEKTGYTVMSVHTEEYKKKGLFGWGKE